MNTEKILLIDDLEDRIESAYKLLDDRMVGVLAFSHNMEQTETEEAARDFGMNPSNLYIGNEEIIQKALSEAKYDVIILDGNLELYLEGEYYDGAIVARKIRDGTYGTLNRETPISSISTSTGVIPQATSQIYSLDSKENLQNCLEEAIAKYRG